MMDSHDKAWVLLVVLLLIGVLTVVYLGKEKQKEINLNAPIRCQEFGAVIEKRVQYNEDFGCMYYHDGEWKSDRSFYASKR